MENIRKKALAIAKYKHQLVEPNSALNGGKVQGNGSSHWNSSTGELVVQGHPPVYLSPKLRQFFECLYKNQNRPVTVGKIAQNLYSGNRLKDPGAAIHTDVSRVRKILDSSGLSHYMQIENVKHGIYRLAVKM